MAAAIETVAYTREAPWNGIGNKVSNKLSPEQMLRAAKLDWTVSKRPMAFQNTAGVWVPSKTDFAIVRDTDESHLSTVGNVYKPVQNADSMSFFKKFTAQGHMAMEHAGSLAGGRYIWVLAHIDGDFTLGKEDEVKSYLLLCSPHIHGKAMVFQYVSIRTWCWNTLGRILRGAARGKGNGHVFRMRHSAKFDEATKAAATLALGLGKEQAQAFKAEAELLAKKKAKPADVEEFFCEVLQYDPKKAKKKQDGAEREPNKLPRFREALTHAPGQQLATATGTWWGAVNAVTYVVDHETGRGDRSIALKNAWLGHTAGIKRRAFDLALARAK